MTTQPSRSNPNKTYITGSILILLGILFFVGQVVQSPVFGLLILPGLGLIFIIWALLVRSFGLLIPGGILLGIGVGDLLIGGLPTTLSGLDDGGVYLIAFGLGWMLIALLSPLTTHGFQWWPLIPGGILSSLGLLILAGAWGETILQLASYVWPLILVALGVYILFKRTRSA